MSKNLPFYDFVDDKLLPDRLLAWEPTNSCYANYDGNLTPASMGMFTQTCQNRHVDTYLGGTASKPQPILSADCSQGPGQATKHCEVNLGKLTLTFHNFLGSEALEDLC